MFNPMIRTPTISRGPGKQLPSPPEVRGSSPHHAPPLTLQPHRDGLRLSQLHSYHQLDFFKDTEELPSQPGSSSCQPWSLNWTPPTTTIPDFLHPMTPPYEVIMRPSVAAHHAIPVSYFEASNCSRRRSRGLRGSHSPSPPRARSSCCTRQGPKLQPPGGLPWPRRKCLSPAGPMGLRRQGDPGNRQPSSDNEDPPVA